MAPTAGNIEKPQPDDIAGIRAMHGLNIPGTMPLNDTGALIAERPRFR